MNLTNEEIRRIYLDNLGEPSTKWMASLLSNLEFLVELRIKKLKNFYLIEDLRQELRLALWKAVKTFDCQKDFDFYRWSAWFLSKAKRDFLRKFDIRNSINLRNVDVIIDVEEVEHMILIGEILRSKKIKELEKDIISMYYIEGKTLKEISQNKLKSIERIRQIRNITLSKLRV